MRLLNTILSVFFIFISFQSAFATNYTWNGSSSSDWGTAANWTPSGVPGASDNVTIVSAGTAPVYDGVAGVTAFNLYSGSLDLNGYTLNITGQGYFSGGSISNGVVNATGTITYFFGGTINTKVIVTSEKPYLNGATFNDSLIVEVTGNGGQSNGGNVFNGPVVITNSGNYSPYYGHQNPDTFNYNLHIYNTGNGGLTFANASDDHYFADTVFVNCTSGQGIYFGNSGVEYEMDGPIIIGTSGFSSGILKLRDFVQQGNDDFDLTLTGAASIWLENCEFGGDVTLDVPYIDYYYTTFNGEFNLTRSGSTSNTAKGGNLYNDTVTIVNMGGVFTTALNYPDTFNGLVTIINEGSGAFTLGYGTANNYFNGDVKVYNLTTSAALQFQPFGASGSTTFNGNVYVNSKSSGGVHFAPGNTPTLTMTEGHIIAIGDTGFIDGTLTIRKFEQEGLYPIDLTLTGAANLKIDDSELGGDFTFDGPGFILDGATFNGDAHFTRDTTANEQLLGSNTYYGDATFINNGTGYLMFRTSDTYYGTATFIATSTGYLKPGNYSTNTFKGNIHVNDPDVVTFGLDYAGSKVVLDGDGAQMISSDSLGIIEFRDLESDKSEGFTIIDRSISILDSLILTDGIIQTDTFFIEIKDNAKAVGAADTSYVEGKVKKTGNEAFTYPVGKNGHYKPIAISAPSSTTAEFVAEYLNKNSDDDYSHTSKDGTINRLSTNEYWNLDRTATTNTVSVTLSWEEMSCVLDTLANLKIAAWDGSQWKDLGNGGTTGDTAVGTIVTSSVSTIYGPLTLATIDTFRCTPCMAFAGNDTIIEAGQYLKLGEEGDYTNDYIWTPNTWMDDDTLANPVVHPHETTVYSVAVTNPIGCVATDKVNVEVPPDQGFTLVICEDNSIQAFGTNREYQLGQGTTQPLWSELPLDVNSLSSVTSVAVGRSHGLALLNNGTVYSWGVNGSGQTGQPFGNPSQVSEPELVPNLSCVKAIAAGQFFSAALLDDGTIQTWGSNNRGQLGDGTNTPSYTPVQVTGISNAIAISAGTEHMIALLDDGTVKAWGVNNEGQLGNGNTSPSNVPVSVSNLSSIIKIDAGGLHNIALKNDNSIYTWGANYSGQLGNGSTSYSSTPVTPTGWTSSAVADISASRNNTMILKSDGTSLVCGTNVWGGFGVCSPSSSNTLETGPTLSNAIEIVSPSSHNHQWAIGSDGKLWTWGYNQEGQLGLGYTSGYECVATWVNDPELLENYCPIIPSSQPTSLLSISVTFEDYICGSNDGTLTAAATGGVGPYTYSWSPSTGLSATNVANPTVDLSSVQTSVTYTVTITDASGCSKEEEVTVSYHPCCEGHYYYMPNPPGNDLTISVGDDDHSSDWSGGSIIGNGWNVNYPSFSSHNRLAINGTFTIDASSTFSLEDIHILMGTDARIVIENGATLTIDNCWIDACDDMWLGISVQPGGKLIIETSLIEDAQAAVTTAFPVDDAIDITGTYFNKNYRSIIIGFSESSTDPGIIQDNFFLCQTTTSIGGAADYNLNLLPPFDQDISYAGIQMVGVGDITIGDTIDGNYFDNGYFGIYSSYSNVEVIGNEFHNINPPDWCTGLECWGYGKGIFATTGDETNRTLDVHDDNEFYDSFWGIQTLNNMNLVVNNNYFTDIEFVGVSASNSVLTDRSIEITDNTMEDMNVGVYMSNNKSADIDITGNDIDIDETTWDDGGMGIVVNEIMPLSATQVEISDNDTVTDATLGIWVNHLHSNSLVSGNTVEVQNTSSGFEANGIFSESSFHTFISDNYVTASSTDDWRNGIRLDIGSNNWVNCNTTEDIGIGLFMGGALEPTRLLKNEMNTNYTGLQIHNGTIGNVGIPDVSWDNIWVGTFGNYHIDNNVNLQGYNFYYRHGSTGIPNLPTLIRINSFIFVPATKDLSTLPCPTTNGSLTVPEDEDLEAEAMRILEDTLVIPYYDDERRWMEKFGLYMNLLEDEDLRTADALISDFYDSCRVSNVGKLLRAIDVFDEPDNFDDAVTYLDTVSKLSTSITPESALTTIIEISLEKYLDTALVVDGSSFQITSLFEELLPDSTFTPDSVRNYNYSPAQLILLDSIAEECVYEYGIATTMARAMLNYADSMPKRYYNTCELVHATSARMGGNEVNQQPTDDYEEILVNVYPNPATDILYVELLGDENLNGVIKVYSTTGALIMNNTIKSGLNTLGVSNIPSGLVYFHVEVGGRIVSTGKQIISH